MAFQTTPNGIEVALHGAQEGIPVVNIFHIKAPGAVTFTDLENIETVFQEWVDSDWLPMLHNTYVLNDFTVLDISEEDGIKVTHPYVSGNAGGVGGDPTPANAALVVSWRTAQTGRSYRGRTYVGAIGNNFMVDPHNVDSTFASGVADNMAALKDAIETAGYTLSVLSRVLNKVVRVVGVLTEIVSIIVDTKVDSQRRRTAN